MSEAEQESLVNGKNIQFEYNVEKKGKKKGKKKHTKVHVTDVRLENPDEDYPESRVLKQDKDGSLLIQKLEPVKPKKKATKAIHDNGLLPTDPDELNQKLGEYWNELSVERKKDLLNLERDSVFKIMRDQQKITCNCSVCDRKRSIIEQELKKLYDTYYEGIENSHLLLSELFNFSKDDYQNTGMRKQPTVSSKQESVKKKGIMTIAEDLLQNDGRKFLEMMEKLAESRIKRHTELLKNTQKEEEDEDEYYSDDHINDTYLEDSQHFGQTHEADTTQASPLRPSAYKIPPQEEFELPEDPVGSYWSKSDEEEYVSSEDPDYDTEQADEDETEDEAVPEPLSLSTLTEFHKEMLDLLEEQQDMFVRDGYNMTNNVNDEKILEMHIMRQKLLQRQLKQEHEKLKQFQDHPRLEASSEDLDLEDVEALENAGDEQVEAEDAEEGEDEENNGEEKEQEEEQEQEQDEGQEEREQEHEQEQEEDDDEEQEEDDDDDDLEDEESLSDEPIDEEQQLAEGRAMLQLCATKMLRQSLLQSYKEMLIRKQAENLLEELQEDEEQKRRKEEKKHREREKRKEKKRLVQLQKEEERQRKAQEEERIAREKREEMIRKTEEGRRRKQEEDRKKREEQLRKEEELEKQRKIKEEKKRLKEEQKRLEEEAKREKEEEERRLKQVEEQRLKEVELLKQQQEYELQMQRLKSIEDKKLQDQLLAEELQEKIRLQELQQQSRSNSNISVQDFHSQPLTNPLFENVVQQSPFISSPLVSSPQANQTQFSLPLQQNGFQQPTLFSNPSSIIWGNQAHSQPQSNTSQMSASSLLGSSQQQKASSNLDLLLGSFSQNMSVGGVASSSTSNSFLKTDTVWGNNNNNSSSNNSGSNWSNITDSWTTQTTPHHATQPSQVSMQQTSAQVSQPMSQRNEIPFYPQQSPQPQESLPDLVKNHHRLINQAYQSLPKGVDGYVYVENLLLAAQKLSPNLDRKLLIALLYEKSDEYQFDLYTDESNVIIYVRIIVKGFSTLASASRNGSSFLGSVVEPTTNGFSDGFESRMTPGLRESIW